MGCKYYKSEMETMSFAGSLLSSAEQAGVPVAIEVCMARAITEFIVLL